MTSHAKRRKVLHEASPTRSLHVLPEFVFPTIRSFLGAGNIRKVQRALDRRDLIDSLVLPNVSHTPPEDHTPPLSHVTGLSKNAPSIRASVPPTSPRVFPYFNLTGPCAVLDQECWTSSQQLMVQRSHRYLVLKQVLSDFEMPDGWCVVLEIMAEVVEYASRLAASKSVSAMSSSSEVDGGGRSRGTSGSVQGPEAVSASHAVSLTGPDSRLEITRASSHVTFHGVLHHAVDLLIRVVAMRRRAHLGRPDILQFHLYAMTCLFIAFKYDSQFFETTFGCAREYYNRFKTYSRGQMEGLVPQNRMYEFECLSQRDLLDCEIDLLNNYLEWVVSRATSYWFLDTCLDLRKCQGYYGGGGGGGTSQGDLSPTTTGFDFGTAMPEHDFVSKERELSTYILGLVVFYDFRSSSHDPKHLAYACVHLSHLVLHRLSLNSPSGILIDSLPYYFKLVCHYVRESLRDQRGVIFPFLRRTHRPLRRMLRGFMRQIDSQLF